MGTWGRDVQKRADDCLIAHGAAPATVAAAREDGHVARTNEELRRAVESFCGTLTREQQQIVSVGSWSVVSSVLSLWEAAATMLDGRTVMADPFYFPALEALGWTEKALTPEEHKREIDEYFVERKARAERAGAPPSA